MADMAALILHQAYMISLHANVTSLFNTCQRLVHSLYIGYLSIWDLQVYFSFCFKSHIWLFLSVNANIRFFDITRAYNLPKGSVVTFFQAVPSPPRMCRYLIKACLLAFYTDSIDLIALFRGGLFMSQESHGFYFSIIDFILISLGWDSNLEPLGLQVGDALAFSAI